MGTDFRPRNTFSSARIQAEHVYGLLANSVTDVAAADPEPCGRVCTAKEVGESFLIEMDDVESM